MNIRPFKGFAMPLALVLGATGASVALAQSTSESSSSQEEIVLEKFEVTGSRIKRLDVETPNPVVSINAGTIESMGFPTIADAVRALPFNNGQALTPTDAGTSFTPGVSSFNLRGLGNNGTLVLINGRRAVPYASPGFDGFQTVFDLNSIPDSAIESVDILKDGGSALYGSDAVAGVVNFRIKKNYVGAEASLEVGNYFVTDALYKKASLSFGTVGRNTSMFTSISWSQQEAVYNRDLPYTADADKTGIAPQNFGWYDIPEAGYKAAGYNTLDEYTADVFGSKYPTEGGWWDNRSSRGFPGYLAYDFNGNGSISSSERRTYADPQSAPGATGYKTSPNYYNFNETSGLFPSTQRFNLFSTIDHEISEHLSVFSEISWSRSEGVIEAAATPVDIETSHGLNSGDQLTYPSYNPFNPFGVDFTNGRRRLIELPTRVNDVTSDTPRFLVGLRGDMEASAGFFQEWNWEIAGLYSKNTVDNNNPGAVPDYRMQEAFNGLTRLGDGSLSWDPTTPKADRVYFNWFGYNEAAFADFLAVNNPNQASIEYRGADFRLDGPLMDLPGGQVGLAIGGENRREDFANIKSDLNATGNILGGSEGTSSFGSRELSAVYAELDLPIHKMLEVQLAGRYEAYSDDGFERKVRPKVAVKFRPLDWLIIRGSYAESFKAPDLAYLYTAAQTSFSSNQITDPVTKAEIDQLQVVTAGNPDLKPETTDTVYFGISLEPEGRLKGLSLSVDYFNFDQTNLLAQLSDFYGYTDFISQNYAGNSLFAGKVVRDPVSNQVLYIKDDYANISDAQYKGFDFSAVYTWDTNSLGRFAVSASATKVDSYSLDGNEQVGGHYTAEWNGNGAVNWAYKDFSVNAFVNYRGARLASYHYGEIFGTGDDVTVYWRIKPQVSLNASVSYTGFEKTKILVGVNNVLGTWPPLDGFEPVGTTPGINSVEPAYWYAKITREF